MVKVKCFYPTKILNFSFGFPKIISACSTYPTWWPVSIPLVNAWSSPTSKRVCSGFAIAATRTSSSFLRTTRILAGWRRPVCWTSTPWLRLTSLATLALWVHGPGLIVSFTFHVESFSMFECEQLLREAERRKKKSECSSCDVFRFVSLPTLVMMWMKIPQGTKHCGTEDSWMELHRR